MSLMQEKLLSMGVTYEAEFVPRSKSDDPAKMVLNWRVRFRRLRGGSSSDDYIPTTGWFAYTQGIGWLKGAPLGNMTLYEQEGIIISLERGLAYQPKGSAMWREKLDPPDAKDVIDCVLMDASAYGQTFRDWCDDLGYSSGHPADAYEIYMACLDASVKLHRVFTHAEMDALRDVIQADE